MRIRVVFFVCLIWGSGAVSSAAATLTVCSSGCAYTALQPAIDAASPGDTILLRAGQTFVGNVVLRAKPASTSWITIRSDAADSNLPADGVRLVPSGKPGANTSRSLLPRLLGQGGALKTTPVIRTAAGAHHYVLKFLEVDGAANLGFETLITIGDDTTAAPAQDIVIDRIYAHGDPYKGMKRGVTLNGVRTDILNSYFSDIMAVNADSQAIAGYNGAGPFRIINNYLEAAGENVMFGGSDPAVQGLVPTGIEIRRNHFFKQLAWQNPILAAPPTPGIAVSTLAGSLTAGRHYFKVVALLTTDSRTVVSVPSPEVSALMPGGKAVTLSWTAIPGAERYRLYRGTTAGGESRYLETPGAVTSFTYTGASEASGTPGTATKWAVKNILELKNARQVVIDGNILENIWQAGQFGYAFVLTPRNQSGTAPWVHVRDITITNNIVRHAAGVLQIAGYDSTNTSEQTRRITVRNNLFYDIDSVKWGASTAKVFLVGEGPADVVIDRNTIIAANSTVLFAYGSPQMTGFVYTNNIARHNTYGLNGDNGRSGSYSLDMYFPGGIVTNNVLAGGTASLYPTPNAFPTVAEWDASFANAAAADYRLLTTSVFYAAGAGGSVPGANIGTLNAAIAGSGSPAPPPVEPPPPPDANGTLVLYPGKSSTRVGAWTTVADSLAAGGQALVLPNIGRSKVTTALATPSAYAEVTLNVVGGKPYRLWLRGKATGNAYANDSVFVQFSGAVDANGVSLYRIGTTAAAVVNLEDCNGCGLSGWGWQDNGWGSGVSGPLIFFPASGAQTIRIQNREDGLLIDQLVLSPDAFLATAPGALKDDRTIYAENAGGTTVAPQPSAPAPEEPPADNLVPIASPGGPYTGTKGTSLVVDGSGSSDADGTIAGFSWQWGDEVVVNAGDTAATTIVGSAWTRVSASGAAGGAALHNPDKAAAKVTTALAAPASYVDVRFYAASGVPYHLWFRMKAQGDSYTNDSMFVQFSGAVTSAGAAVNRVGTSSAASVILEEGNGGGVSGWGWNDDGYGTLAAPVYFATSGLQTLRVQQREDGIMWDQVVLSAGTFFSARPGLTRADTTVVAPQEGQGMVTSHIYPSAGTYPIRLTVTDDKGATGTALTSVVIK